MTANSAVATPDHNAGSRITSVQARTVSVPLEHVTSFSTRKGFYSWDETSIAREQQRYQLALGKAMQILRDEEDAAAAAGGDVGVPATG